jgi:hypothetical protein
LKRKSDRNQANIESEFTASYTERLEDVHRSVEDALEARKKNGEDMNRKREAEDEQLKNDVFSTFEAMALPDQGKKHPNSNSNTSSSVTGNLGANEEQKASKRQKPNPQSETTSSTAEERRGEGIIPT